MPLVRLTSATKTVWISRKYHITISYCSYRTPMEAGSSGLAVLVVAGLVVLVLEEVPPVETNLEAATRCSSCLVPHSHHTGCFILDYNYLSSPDPCL
jgi:hypothetical protein